MGSMTSSNTSGRVTYRSSSTIRILWLIAWRQIVEAVRNRSTLVMTGFFLILPLILVVISLRPVLQDPKALGVAGSFIALYLLMVGLMPATPAIGIASGVFAGDKERGCLIPLLVTPASNTAIFAGKVLGAVLPALAFAAIGIIGYLVEIAVLFGPDKLGLMPGGLLVMILLLIPAISLFGAALACVISSRVSTFQSAQNYSSLILVVLWFGLFGLLFLIGLWGLWVFAAAVAFIFLLDILLIAVSAATWKREEVMARQ